MEKFSGLARVNQRVLQQDRPVVVQQLLQRLGRVAEALGEFIGAPFRPADLRCVGVDDHRAGGRGRDRAGPVTTAEGAMTRFLRR